MPTLETVRPIQHIERFDLLGSVAGVAIKICGGQDRDGNSIDAAVGHYLTDGVISVDRPETAMSFAVWQDPEPVDVSERVLLLGAYRRGEILGGKTASKIQDEGIDVRANLLRISSTARRATDRVYEARRLGQRLPPSGDIVRSLNGWWRELLIGSLLRKADLFEDIEELTVAAKSYEAFAQAKPSQVVEGLQTHMQERVRSLREDNPLVLL